MERNTQNLPTIDVRAYPLQQPRDNLLAFASVTIADCFAIRGVKVLSGKNGPYVAMPQMKDSSGEWKDICFPTNGELRKELNRAVLGAYDKELQTPNKSDTARPQPAQRPYANNAR